jgi:hypothetical protein
MNDVDLDVPIWGAAAIAAEINRTTRQTHHLLEIKALPADKVGGQWTSTRRRLRSLFNGKSNGNAA